MTTLSAEPGQAAPVSRSPERRRWWRTLRWVAVGLTLLAVVFYSAGGWYFAGQIESGALRVDPGSVDRNLQVTSVATGTITLHEKDGRVAALHTDEVYGLQWDSGYGQLSGPVKQSGKDVTRTFRLLDGTSPRSGATAGVSRDAFPDDPSVSLGRTVQHITYQSPLGVMPAWFVPGTSSTWAVLVHGWTASRTEMLRLMRLTVDLGLPSLDITYRNDAHVPADPTHRYQFGRTEWRDLDAAVRYAEVHGAQSIALIGASMGGGVIASFMQHAPRARLVRMMILDAPMLSLSRVVNLAASRRSLPVIGIRVPYSLTWTAKRIAALRYEINWSTLDYLHNTKWVRVPTLVFHGDADTRVPLSGSRALARAQSDRVTLVVVHGANHLESWNRGPANYERQVSDFLRWHA